MTAGDIVIPFTEQRDEIGSMARSIESFKAMARSNERLVAKREQVTASAGEARRRTTAELGAALDQQVGRIVVSTSEAVRQL